ncbi:penicillin-binding transpeptidase domain-containing protein [Alteribacter keqinensis]|nr:penicillin-binding transpeptidase domain-containing protein [Alteribacter keqinensis]
MIRKSLYIGLGAGFVLLAGCSGEDPNPEETLEDYLSSWESGDYAGMENLLTEASASAITGEELSFSDKYEELYEELGVTELDVSFTGRDFEEEEVDLGELEEITYPVQVGMETVIGSFDYDTDVTLLKEEGEDGEEWRIDWKAGHLFMGMQAFSDSVEVTTEAPDTRGQIFAGNGESLAVNGTYMSIGFVFQDIEDLDAEAEELSDIIGLDEERILELVAGYEENPEWHAPVMNVPNGHAFIDEVLEAQIPGVLVREYTGREYGYGSLTAHLTGHLAIATADFLEKNDWPGYHGNSYYGRRGLENAYEETLRGKVGSQVNIVDGEGNQREVLQRTEAENGEDLFLTIDMELQEKLHDAMGDEMGAGVVMDPVSGEVLAMVSKPDYNPGELYLRTTSIEEEQTLNRYNFRFSPGSVFKPLTAAIGLEEGTLDPEEQFTITGEQWQPEGSDWGNHQITRVNDDVDIVDLEAGMKYSDNIYFAMQALEIGEEKMEAWTERFGFGGNYPFEYPIYVSNLSNEGLGNSALLADTGYGQGEVQMNPVHLASLYTMFVNEGSIVQPVLFQDEDPAYFSESVISEETASTVLDSMVAVVEDPNGTAYRSNPGHSRSLAGKTGTAEIKDSQDDVDGDRIGWYASVDVEERDLLLVMMVEGAGSGEVVDKVNEFWASLE